MRRWLRAYHPADTRQLPSAFWLTSVSPNGADINAGLGQQAVKLIRIVSNSGSITPAKSINETAIASSVALLNPFMDHLPYQRRQRLH